MRRILVIGNSGGGKSTLARRLGEKLGLPVVHLDVLFWKPGWTESETEEFRARTATALDGDGWVCDGDFRASYDLRMPLADTIVWLDQPVWLCLFRAIRRVITGRIQGRPDMAEGCAEGVDFAFYGFILTYNSKVRPEVEAALTRHGAHAEVVRLRNDREIDAFLAQA